MNNIYKTINLVMNDIDAVSKDRKNATQGWSYRSIDQIYNAINMAMCKHGLFSIPSVLDRSVSEHTNQKGGIVYHVTLKVSYKFTALDGSSIDVILFSEALDNSDKATNKALAFAHKYALLQLFCIPTEDMIDGDKDHIEVVKPVTKVKEKNIAQLKSEINALLRKKFEVMGKDKVVSLLSDQSITSETIQKCTSLVEANLLLDIIKHIGE